MKFTFFEKSFSLLVMSLLFTATCVFGAVQPKLLHIGLLTGGHGFGAAESTFRESLRQLGWNAGQNIAIDSRLAEALPDRLPELAAELVRLRVATIVADGDPAIAAARRVTSSIPIVMVAIGDPVSEGFVSSLARPGANITGVTSVSAELSGKRLEILREVSPAISQVGVIWNPGNASNSLEFKEMDHTAPRLGVKLHSLEVRAVNDFQVVFARAVKDHVGALVLVRDPIIDSEHFRILDFVIEKHVLSMHGEEQFTEAGGLMSYGPRRVELFRRAAVYVDKILTGAKPADLPVEQPRKFELAINLKTAKQIGLTIPPNVLARADKVIK
jgi:ABC-type uncharacterized transport system substrate-binding protein